MPEYFIKRGDTVSGPFSPVDLQHGVANGGISAGDLVGKSENGPWHEAKSVPGLVFPDSHPTQGLSDDQVMQVLGDYEYVPEESPQPDAVKQIEESPASPETLPEDVTCEGQDDKSGTIELTGGTGTATITSKMRKTLIDYFLVALCQMLIGLLVGSLGFLLIEITYQGPYDHRLGFIMGMFVMGTVVIARISLEEITEHGMLYSVLLGVVAFLAIMLTVEFRGRWEALTLFIDVGILVLIWWASHLLTRDCWFKEMGADPGGTGLMESLGLDDQETSKKVVGATDDSDHLLEDKSPGWWQRWLKRRHHSPGLWSVDFSVAALPLFGLWLELMPGGGGYLPRYAFNLLLLYVASGLGLLLLTSFLGLRRYQRNPDMPSDMSIWRIWCRVHHRRIAKGIAIVSIIGLIIFALIVIGGVILLFYVVGLSVQQMLE